MKFSSATCFASLVLALCALAVTARAQGLLAPAADRKLPPFELADGDRVAYIGNAFFEREQRHAYLETLLATRWPDRKVTFRNLAWSGDTVFGHARSGFETPTQGFERLVRSAYEARPTVLFICYGMAESFEGEKGVEPFQHGLTRLLDRLSGLGARTVLVSPIRHENLGPPFPDPTKHNQELRRYADAMKSVADARGHRFVDLYQLLSEGNEQNRPGPRRPLTENGIHLSPYGYWRAAVAIEKGLGLPEKRDWPVEPDEKGRLTNGGEAIRELALAKNVQFFNQWRPENETYLFGFRRNEQGQNAREIPMFDQHIADLEARMTKCLAAGPQTN